VFIYPLYIDILIIDLILLCYNLKPKIKTVAAGCNKGQPWRTIRQQKMFWKESSIRKIY